ncbi:methyl-accepting chemotaxis sensory transducer [Gloeomargarita lithophora Alchichica-D10]|uniref:Methyl-accepting chemotaxis sensory transducer n=1 Tax=Gloeomargarita lithophora Alchichica-D10 TaxID=1188229 RepID=A0A1J0A8Y6_9CYAN|nr:methyl-accepting chemotaxis protein [Gloeomargarita lithophora]APB32390.1 methyl-accepting chemotaxis sensory transducer [Gloeomargarita lithophora Alchichica-D10]
MEPSRLPTPEWLTARPDEVPGTREQPEAEAEPLLERYLQGQDARDAGDVEGARRIWQEVVAQDPQGSYGAAAQVALGELPAPLLIEATPSVATKTQLNPVLWWRRTPFRTKLAAILLVWTAVPVVVLTQAQVRSVRQTVTQGFQDTLTQGTTALREEYIDWLSQESLAQAQTVAQLLQTNPRLIQEPNPLMQTLLRQGLAANEREYPELTKNFRLVLDRQGQVQQQAVVMSQEDFRVYPSLPAPGQAIPPYRTRSVVLPGGTNLGQLPWVQQALKTQKPVVGLTLVSLPQAQKLGIAPQAKIPLRNRNSLYAQELNQGVGLVALAVQPVVQKGQVLGAVLVGSLFNRNHWLVDLGSELYELPLIAVYARDMQVATNFPDQDGNTRAIGSLAPPAVAKALLQQGQDSLFTTRKIPDTANGQDYLMLFQTLRDSNGQPVGLLAVGQPTQELEQLLWERTRNTYGLGLGILLLAWGLGLLVANLLAQPVRRLTVYARALGQNRYQERLTLTSQDEFALLAQEMSQMASQVETHVQTLHEQQQQAEAARAELEADVIQLLMDIEGAQQGDLTVRAHADTGQIASIADAFNVTLASLRTLVGNVRATTDRVGTLAGHSEAAVVDLAQAAQSQELELTQALELAAENTQAIQTIAQRAAEATTTAQSSLQAAQEGQEAMDATASLYNQIREAVGKTSKKVKHLVGSSQEISQVLAIIQEISVQTNLLSFNASLESDRAGEHGQGFRLIADEIGQLANLVRKETARIEALVRNIQQDTADVSNAMESSTSAVVEGSLLVQKTQQVLQQLAELSGQMAEYQAAIAGQTQSHSRVSSQVQTAMENVAAIAATTSGAAQEVGSALQELDQEVRQLQQFVLQFRLQPDAR